MTGKFSMVFSGCCALVLNGVICLSATALGLPLMNAFENGEITARLRPFLLAYSSSYVKTA